MVVVLKTEGHEVTTSPPKGQVVTVLFTEGHTGTKHLLVGHIGKPSQLKDT